MASKELIDQMEQERDSHRASADALDAAINTLRSEGGDDESGNSGRSSGRGRGGARRGAGRPRTSGRGGARPGAGRPRTRPAAE